MNIRVSNEFPLVHQILFTEHVEDVQPNNMSKKIEKQFGEENYRLWTLQRTINFLEVNYDNKVLNSFLKLKPYAYKADLARYCILNYFGGLYLDINVDKVKTFDADGVDMVLFRDLNSPKTSWKVANNFFYSRPSNPILQDCISQCIKNVEQKYYGLDPHFPTGPSVFGRSVVNFSSDLNLIIGQYYWFKHRKNKYVLPPSSVVGRHKRGGAFLGGRSGILGGNNYNEMWANKDVYN